MKTKVRVADIGHPSLVLRWIDPLSGAERQRTTGTNKRADALRQAGKLQAELNEGRYVEVSRMSWAELREMTLRLFPRMKTRIGFGDQTGRKNRYDWAVGSKKQRSLTSGMLAGVGFNSFGFRLASRVDSSSRVNDKPKRTRRAMSS